MSVEQYPTWVEVNLSAVEHNTRYVTKRVEVPLMAVVKANAYGHGAVEVGKAALAGGATWLAVARLNEARELRKAGIAAPVLIFGMVTPGEVDEAIALDVSIVMYSREVAETFSARGLAAGKPVRAHLKVDTGLGRLGVLPWQAADLASYAIGLGGIDLEGMFSHFAVADLKDQPMTRTQIQRFNEAHDAVMQAGVNPKWVHIANSAGTLDYPDARFTMVRSGSTIVGLRPFSDRPFPDYLRRALTWKTRVGSCKLYPKGWSVSYGGTYTTEKDEWVAVIPVGYGDGFRRNVPNEVLLGGARRPVIGKVCMDQCMIKLDEPVPFGTEIVLIGQQGSEAIQPEDVAARWGTNEVDTTTLIHARVPRVYTRD